MLLSIVMPVFNECQTVRTCIDRVLATPHAKELLIVDDGSTDGTRDVLRQVANDHPGVVRLFFQTKNQGKGAALRVGIEAAAGDVVLIQDADLEYDPSDYSTLLRPIAEGKADAVFGSRFLGGAQQRVLFFWHSVGNKFLTLLSNAFTDLNLTDMETCYKVFRRQLIQNIVLENNRFGFEVEVTAKIAKSRCVVYEVPISYHGRTYEEGKKITWRDGVAAFAHIVKFNLLRDERSSFKLPWTEVTGLVNAPTKAPESSQLIEMGAQ
jgi:glycosyltransferase involved in cell wall biosynthesis